jgi:putative hydrolase of the HAD superfamily
MTFYKINFLNTVFVLDLDDTLYKEADYRNSGIREIAKYLKKYYKIKINHKFINKCIDKKKNFLKEICRKYNLQKSIVETLLWIYRLHIPSICLKKKVKKSLFKLKKISAGVAILTDGRSFTQRFKLQALGINNLPFYISEDYNDAKPSLKRFKLIMKEMPAKKYIYIADNPSKDFLAPNKLKWLTFGIKDKKNNIHSFMYKNKNKKYLPKFWIKNLSEIFIFSNY